MAPRPPLDLHWQPSLFGAAEAPAFDATFAGVQRIALDGPAGASHAHAWVDFAPGWVNGHEALFRAIVAERPWQQRKRWMYDKEVLEPRLTAPWSLERGEPLRPPLLEAMREALSARYGVTFDSVGFNLYRDGSDSVAWHGDRIDRAIAEPIVVLVSLGAPRRFLMRPRSGGKSVRFELGNGALLVTGGTAQRTWQHAVPKCAKAGARISLAFRHGLDPKAYGE